MPASIFSLVPATRQQILLDILPTGQDLSASAPFPPILQVSQLLRQEGIPLWRNKNTFTIRYAPPPNLSGGAEATFSDGVRVLKRSGLRLCTSFAVWDDVVPSVCPGSASEDYLLRALVLVSGGMGYTVTLRWEGISPNPDSEVYRRTMRLGISKTRGWVAALELAMTGGGFVYPTFVEMRGALVEEDLGDRMGMVRREVEVGAMPVRVEEEERERVMALGAGKKGMGDREKGLEKKKKWKGKQ
ncbi:hypothetical protein LTR56_005404 [Elasticomyces elasticus]|nr:hypothetical protein LTR22_020635 [Elasticomyces elasticus]KAK3651895.1 hypothetical protein LTR56_005404 [Elasticomyces elasticus]KAK4927790.1 hypothetical protein LTR49_005416 [Elasticomyces elasticus]KAK5761461.1 hypothetical protein LTS12_008424 [Elasticomyces elasticus]